MSRRFGIIGVIFGLVYSAGLFLDNGPSQDLSDARTAAWYASHGMGQWLMSSALVALAGICAIVFTVVLRQRVSLPGDRSAAVQLVSAGGYVAAAVVLVGAALFGTIPAAHLFNSAALPTPPVSRALLGAAYAAVVLVAPLAFGVMIAAVSVLGLRHRSLPRWAAVIGFPVAALQLANAVAPMVTLVAWSVLTGVVLVFRRFSPAVPDPERAAALA